MIPAVVLPKELHPFKNARKLCPFLLSHVSQVIHMEKTLCVLGLLLILSGPPKIENHAVKAAVYFVKWAC
jgi:hypothetical protein